MKVEKKSAGKLRFSKFSDETISRSEVSLSGPGLESGQKLTHFRHACNRWSMLDHHAR